MLLSEEIRLMRDRYADYLLNIEQKPKWRRKLMDFHWRCRSQVYGLLEKPKTPLSVCYHIAIFIYILVVHTWSSLISQNAMTEKHVNLLASLEKAIAFYFLIEFLLRIWSAGADNRFQSWKGRKKFLLQPMCIVDTFILILAITAVLLAEYKYSGRFMDVLRFIQILRFFHIDRQMVSWTLLRNFIKHSSFELISIYYITSFVIALMASIVFTLESNEAQGGLIPDSENATFSNYGEAFWFSAVSIFTIGYGDIVPEKALTKILVCMFSYMGLIMFGAASTLVGVGLSLMLDHRNKEQKETKLRNLAATTIQIWYRYHLVTNEQTFNSIPIYATFCVNLNRYELKQQKMNARRVANAGQKQQRRKKKFFINSATDNNLTISSPYELTHAFRSYIVPTIFVSSSEINEDLDRESTYSLPRPETNSELSELQLFARKIATENQRRRGSGTTMNLIKPEKRRHRISLAKLLQSRKVRSGSQHQNEESFESTSDYQPDGLDYGSADERSMGSCMTLSENVSLSSSAMPVLTGKNRATLRLLHYLRFVVVRRRFKRARMPYELDDAEAELCDLEHKRMRAFKQLEKQYAQLIGKKVERDDSDENGNQLMNQKTMLTRVDECENYLAKIETKVNKLEETLIKLMEVIQQKNGDEHVNYSDSSPDTFALQIPFRSPKSAR